MYSAPPRAFLTLVVVCLLPSVFVLNHGAIRTVAADLNHDLAQLVNGQVAGQPVASVRSTLTDEVKVEIFGATG